MPRQRSKPYGPLKFIGDLIMISFTAGLWIVWILVRELRYR